MPGVWTADIDGQQVGRQFLVCGDCLAILPGLASASVDVIVTSPPYNIGLGYGAYDDQRDEADYLDWMVRVATELRRVLRPDGSFFLNVGGSPARPWLPLELLVRLRPLFHMQNQFAWVKSIAIGDDSVGHYKPVPGQRYVHRMWEPVFHLTLSGDVALDRLGVGVPFKDKTNIARRGHAADLRCAGDTWFIPYRTVVSKAGKHHHPATFPEALPRRCIRLHGRPADRDHFVVLDPFAGSGTTLLAAEAEGAVGIGIELDPVYVASARARLEDARVLI